MIRIGLLAALLAVLPAFASPSGVVITGFQVRGAAGGNDEYVEIRNTSAANVDISGWRLQGCSSGTPGNASTRATVGSNVVLTPGQYYLFTNSAASGYSGSVSGDATYGTGITDFSASNFAGIQLLDVANGRQDGVGSPLSPCREGAGITATPTVNGPANAFARTQETDSNPADFVGPQASNPRNSGGITVTCVNDGVRIFAIQGRGHVSPYNGQCVSGVPGIVTQVVGNGFFLQDGDGDGDIATSDGIFVFTASTPVVMAGQQVKVRGNVSEFRPGSSFGATNCPSSSAACNLTITEIVAPAVTPATGLFASAIVTPVVIGTGGRVPPNRILDDDTSGSVEVATQTAYDPESDGIDFFESLEGMRVQVNNARVVGPTNAFGEIWLVGDNGANATSASARGGLTLVENGGGVDYNPERIQIDITALAPDNPRINVGDIAPAVVGALTYDFANFRILPEVFPAFTGGGLEPATSAVVGGLERLRIAAYNVENLDANDADTCDGRPDADIADGRFARLAAHIVGALGSPDILGLTEIQDNSGCTNDGTVDASLTLSALAGAISAAGGPAYAFALVDPQNNADGGAPGANIRPALLWNTARVAFVPGTQGASNATTATMPSLDAGGNVQLSYSPGRIDPTNAAWASSRKPLAATFDFNGRRVLVIVNHFNSKGGDAPLFGRLQPPALGSEVQRLQQAQVENAFVRQVLALDSGARIVSLGDFNDFEFSTPIRTLTGAAAGAPVLTGLATLLPPQERYSYVFQGNSQELDHIFVSAALLPDAQFQAVHVNSEFADPVSDHDPLIASLRIPAPPPVANAGADQAVPHNRTLATLDGSASRAGDGTPLAFAWTQTAGRAVTLEGATGARPTFRTPPQPGLLRFSLTVTDRFGNVATDEVEVDVTPGKPGK